MIDIVLQKLRGSSSIKQCAVGKKSKLLYCRVCDSLLVQCERIQANIPWILWSTISRFLFLYYFLWPISFLVTNSPVFFMKFLSLVFIMWLVLNIYNLLILLVWYYISCLFYNLSCFSLFAWWQDDEITTSMRKEKSDARELRSFYQRSELYFIISHKCHVDI